MELNQLRALGYELPWNNLTFDYRHFVVLDERHVQAKVDKQLARRRKVKTPETKRKADAAIAKCFHDFLHALGAVFRI